MAFGSGLRRRQSLVWEIKDASKYQKDSPVFSLMNSDWILQMNPVYQKGEYSPSSYNINLKICSAYQNLQPFEVVTLLEDRRNKVQMHCSKLTVSSSCETLFRASFDSTYEVLPGLKIYDDMAIVCTFYPSTGLALSVPTVSGSSLRIRHSLVWKTRKPIIYQDRESPLFNLNNSKWKLEIHLINTSQYHSSVYQISIRNSKGIQPFQPFEVEMYLVDKGRDIHIQCSRLNVSSYFEILYRESIDSIYNKVPGLKDRDDIIIMCTFGPPIGVTLNEKMRNDVTMTLDCIQCQFEDRFLQEKERCSTSSQSQSLNFLSDFEKLSKDFGSLLNNSFMADIQLKSGEDIISAHKLVLAARSPVFSKMFKTKISEKSIDTLEVNDIAPSVLQEFLRYLYYGKLSDNMSEEMFCKLYATSDKYEVQSLREMCLNYMIRNLKAENFTVFLVLADMHNDKELREAIAGFITERPKLLMSDVWITFSKVYTKLANEIYHTHVANTLRNI